MTPAQLRKALEGLYGKDLSRWQLCIAFGADVGMHPGAVQKWLNRTYPVPPWAELAVEALEARKAVGH